MEDKAKCVFPSFFRFGEERLAVSSMPSVSPLGAGKLAIGSLVFLAFRMDSSFKHPLLLGCTVEI